MHNTFVDENCPLVLEKGNYVSSLMYIVSEFPCRVAVACYSL